MHFNMLDKAGLQRTADAALFTHLSYWHLGRLKHR